MQSRKRWLWLQSERSVRSVALEPGGWTFTGKKGEPSCPAHPALSTAHADTPGYIPVLIADCSVLIPSTDCLCSQNETYFFVLNTPVATEGIKIPTLTNNLVITSLLSGLQQAMNWRSVPVNIWHCEECRRKSQFSVLRQVKLCKGGCKLWVRPSLKSRCTPQGRCQAAVGYTSPCPSPQ